MTSTESAAVSLVADVEVLRALSADDLESATRSDQTPKEAVSALIARAKMAEYIARVVAAVPPLTPEQRDRLVILLRP